MVKLMETELGDHGAESEDIASAKVTADLTSVLENLEAFELLCANMRQTDIKDEAQKYKDERTAMIEKLCSPMEKSILDLQAIKQALMERLGRIDTAGAYEHLNADAMPAVETDGSSLGEIRAALQSRMDAFNDVFNRSGFAKGGEVDGQSALGSTVFELLRKFDASCTSEGQLLACLIQGRPCDPAAAQAREEAKARLVAELQEALDAAEQVYLNLIHAGKRFLDAEKDSHTGVERPSLFESTRSMLAMEGANIVKNKDHRTKHGCEQLLELLERRLESLRSIPVLRCVGCRPRLCMLFDWHHSRQKSRSQLTLFRLVCAGARRTPTSRTRRRQTRRSRSFRSSSSTTRTTNSILRPTLR